MSEIDINKRLCEYQTKWYNEIVCPWVKKGGEKPNETREWVKKHYMVDEYSFSQPFFTGVYECSENKPLVMFVGQETNGWGKWNEFDGESEISLSQAFVNSFTKNNTLDLDKKIKFRYKDKDISLYDGHSFWNFIREICMEAKIKAVWNELDKIHYIPAGNNDRTKCIRVWKEDKDVLNGEVKDGKSLLQLEIETIQPDLIVFLTGPSSKYVFSMESALKKIVLPCKPNEKEPISSFLYGSIPCLWTYHPGYRKVKKKVDDILKDVINSLIGK